MKAVIYDQYGPPEVLRVEDVAVPLPKPDQVLVKVAATSVNLSDWECLIGSPLYARIGGLRGPANRVLGSDIAGTVEAVGTDVTGFRAGDPVLADNLWLKGGFAEYATVPESELALKPDGLGFVQAATLPQSAAIAFQGTAPVKAGDRVLINGGGGGSGCLAIQLAKRAGAEVTGVDNGSKLDFMRSLGADHVIDYRTEDFTAGGRTYDVILDLVAHRSPLDYRRALASGGRYQCVGGSVRSLLAILTVGTVAGRLSGRRIGVLGVKEGPARFAAVVELCLAGELVVSVDRTFPLEETAQALAHSGRGHALGKVVVEVNPGC